MSTGLQDFPLSPAQLLAQLPAREQQALLKQFDVTGQSVLRWDWQFWARPSQLPPSGSWRFWLISSGRGAGKTRTGAEWVRMKVAQGAKRIGLIAETAGDVRDVLVEGHSGLLSVYPPNDKPLYEPSKRRITWHNGAIAQTYSGDSPDQLRGPNHDIVWADEIAKYAYLDECFSNLDLGLRLGAHPQCVLTTTPRPSPWFRRMLAEARSGAGRIVLTQASTYENAVNLSQDFIAAVRERYEGTRLGRQEIHAELLDESEFALWSYALLESCRVLKAPPLRRIAVGVDPGHDAGIVVAGLGEDGHGYVLEDVSLSGTPMQWAHQAISAYHRHKANMLVVERNHGGEMAETTLRMLDKTVAIRTVWASQGKYARAEPVSSLYEQRRCHHVGMFAALEDELTSWEPGAGLPSPNRLDACVWVITALMLDDKGPMRALELSF
jgi:phage terminase large subunit-like protein